MKTAKAHRMGFMEADIVTVTLNPAIDETVFLDQLKPGTVNRARHHYRQAGGKGVNVSSMLGGFGIPSTATGFLGKGNIGWFEEIFEKRMIRDEFVRLDGETRCGIKIVSQSTRETTDINFPGFDLGKNDLAALEEKLSSLVRSGRWFVVAGSLPAGVTSDDFEKLLVLLKNGGAQIAVDTSGEALRRAIGCGLQVIKPNLDELEELLDEKLPDADSRVAAAVRLQCEKVPHVILSMGGGGALFVTPEGVFAADAPPVEVMSTVGAGDSMLAGYLAGLQAGLPPEERAKLSSVFAWSALEDVCRQPPSRALAGERMQRINVRAVRI